MLGILIVYLLNLYKWYLIIFILIASANIIYT